MPPKKKQTRAQPATYFVRGTRMHNMSDGLFASTSLPAGTLIHSEQPLFHTPLTILTDPHTSLEEHTLSTTLSTNLTPRQRQALSSLNRRGDKLWTHNTLEDTPFTSIVCGSGIPLSIIPSTPGFGELGVFKVFSRLNHACVPNCSLVWSDDEQTAYVYALTDLKPGQQLTISYVPNAAIDHGYLSSRFGFVCACKNFCLRSVAFKERYVGRLQQLDALRGELRDAAEDVRVLEKGHAAIKLMRVLGIWGFRLASLYRVLFEKMVETGEKGKAQFFGVHAYLAMKRYEGRDGGDVVRLVKDVNVAWGFGDEEGVDEQGTFVKLVEKIKEKTPGYLGFVGVGGGNWVEVFTNKTLDEKFEKALWVGEEEDVATEDDGLFVEEDDPIEEEQGGAPKRSSKKVKSTPRKKEDHRAKLTSSEKKKKNNPKRTLPPVPPFPKFDRPVKASPSKYEGGGHVDKRRRVTAGGSGGKGELVDLTGEDNDFYDDDDDEMV